MNHNLLLPVFNAFFICPHKLKSPPQTFIFQCVGVFKMNWKSLPKYSVVQKQLIECLLLFLSKNIFYTKLFQIFVFKIKFTFSSVQSAFYNSKTVWTYYWSHQTLQKKWQIFKRNWEGNLFFFFFFFFFYLLQLCCTLRILQIKSSSMSPSDKRGILVFPKIFNKPHEMQFWWWTIKLENKNWSACYVLLTLSSIKTSGWV